MNFFIGYRVENLSLLKRTLEKVKKSVSEYNEIKVYADILDNQYTREWEEINRKEIKKADIVIFIQSLKMLDSNSVVKELNWAITEKKTIVFVPESSIVSTIISYYENSKKNYNQ